jgi:hypothetical protein
LYTLSPEGKNTLTVRNGRRALLKALPKGERLDQLYSKKWEGKPDEEVLGMIDELLFSRVMKGVLCGDPNFTFNPTSVILARLNRAELGEADALALCLFCRNIRGRLSCRIWVFMDVIC